jgi:hypothetical protein
MAESPVGMQAEQNRDLIINVEAAPGRNMRKEAVVRLVQPGDTSYEIACDEGPWLGGDNTAPPPLAYFAASIAF